MDFSKTSGKEISCKAAVIWEFSKPVKIETIVVKTPGPKEVRVKMVAAGLCHTDMSSVEGYFSVQPTPFVAGHEGGGIVESVGEGVTTVKPGDHVLTAFFPQCRQCSACKGNRTNMCQDIGRKIPAPLPFLRDLGLDGQHKFQCEGQDLFHISGCSSLSEYSVIAENSCVKINSKAPLDKICIVACGFATGYGSATNAVSIQPGDAVAIWGMGGVGLAAVVGAKEKGASKIIGIDLNSSKEKIAKQMGCTDFIQGAKDPVKPLSKIISDITGGGVDFAIVCIGSVEAMEEASYLTNCGGTLVIVGVAHEQTLMNISPAFLLGSRKIVGSLLGDFKVLDDLPKIVDKYVKGDLKQIDEFVTKTITLDEINEGIDIMKTGESVRTVVLF